MSRRSIYTWRKSTMRIDVTNFISIRCFTSRQPPRIHPPQRILVKVYPPRQPYQVLLRKPPSVRVVIPEQIVEVTGLPVGCPPSCAWRLLMTYSAESSSRYRRHPSAISLGQPAYHPEPADSRRCRTASDAS